MLDTGPEASEKAQKTTRGKHTRKTTLERTKRAVTVTKTTTLTAWSCLAFLGTVTELGTHRPGDRLPGQKSEHETRERS